MGPCLDKLHISNCDWAYKNRACSSLVRNWSEEEIGQDMLCACLSKSFADSRLQFSALSREALIKYSWIISGFPTFIFACFNLERNTCNSYWRDTSELLSALSLLCLYWLHLEFTISQIYMSHVISCDYLEVCLALRDWSLLGSAPLWHLLFHVILVQFYQFTLQQNHRDSLYGGHFVCVFSYLVPTYRPSQKYKCDSGRQCSRGWS